MRTTTAPGRLSPAPVSTATPDRVRWADAVRAVALLVVVLGHYLMAVVTVSGGTVSLVGLVESVGWGPALTWPLQVMPCFFAVGAVVAAPGLARRMEGAVDGRARWEVWRDHAARRVRGLVVPALPLLALWVLLGPALGRAFAPATVEAATRAALVPLWFLATYVVVHALLPFVALLVARHGVWRPLAALALISLVVDAVAMTGPAAVGFVNFPVVWLIPTVLGAGVGLGLVRTRPLVVAVAVAIAGAILMLGAGPYDLAVVGAGAGARSNTWTPTPLLAMHAIIHAGTVLLLAPRAEGWLGRTARRRAVLATASRLSMGVYVWHMTALVGVVGLVTAVTVPGLSPLFAVEGLTTAWWVLRPVQMAVWLLATAGLLVLVSKPTAWVSRLSSRRAVRGRAATVLAVPAAAYGIGAIVVTGTATFPPLAVVALGLCVVGTHGPVSGGRSAT